MRLLLDTHIFLWTLDDSPRLSRQAREIMTAPGTECFVSAVSFWEIAINASLRRGGNSALMPAGLSRAPEPPG